jgi:hypothetical protein
MSIDKDNKCDQTSFDCYCNQCDTCHYNPKWYNKTILLIIKTKFIYQKIYY